MARARKSAKRAAAKKKPRSSRGSARKKTSRKKAVGRRSGAKVKTAKRSRRKSGTPLSKRAAKGLRAARSGVSTVKRAGNKIWGRLRATTTQVVEGVRDRLGDEA